MTTVAVKGVEELKREMSRLNVAVARRLSANAATSGAKWSRPGAAPADSGGRERNFGSHFERLPASGL
jgi:hypothetical protein